MNRLWLQVCTNPSLYFWFASSVRSNQICLVLMPQNFSCNCWFCFLIGIFYEAVPLEVIKAFSFSAFTIQVIICFLREKQFWFISDDEKSCLENIKKSVWPVSWSATFFFAVNVSHRRIARIFCFSLCLCFNMFACFGRNKLKTPFSCIFTLVFC